MILLRAEGADSLHEVLRLQRRLEGEAPLEVSEVRRLYVVTMSDRCVLTVSQPSTPPRSMMLVILF